jgi:hypothetical protein
MHSTSHDNDVSKFAVHSKILLQVSFGGLRRQASDKDFPVKGTNARFDQLPLASILITAMQVMSVFEHKIVT